MEIKKVTMKLTKQDSLIAICSINLDNLLVIHNIRLIEGKEGMFLSFPAKIQGEGKYLDIVHPIDTKFRDDITTAIIKKYKEELKKIN